MSGNLSVHIPSSGTKLGKHVDFAFMVTIRYLSQFSVKEQGSLCEVNRMYILMA